MDRKFVACSELYICFSSGVNLGVGMMVEEEEEEALEPEVRLLGLVSELVWGLEADFLIRNGKVEGLNTPVMVS